MLDYISKFENVYFITSYNKKYNNYDTLGKLKNILPNVNFMMYDYRTSAFKEYEILRKLYRLLGLRIRYGSSKYNALATAPLADITPGFIKYILDIIHKHNINIIQIEFLGFHHLVYSLPSHIKTIFIHHELGWVRRELTYGDDIYSSFISAYLKDDEISTLNRFDIIVALTEVDKLKLIKAGIHTRLEVSTLAISNKTQPFTKNKYIGKLTFIGGSGHYPNFDGIKWFVEFVLPLVEKLQSKTILEVIGNWSEESIKSIKSINKNVDFKGFVDDLGQYIKNSIMIVPINIGSGMRMKILEAANYSIPFVSTSIGAEGLDFINGRDCFITQSPEEMADAISKLISDDKLYEMMSENVHNVFVEKYSIDSLGKKRLSLYK